MKIPQINYATPVAPLAKQNVERHVSETAAQQRIVGQVAEVGAKIYTDVQVQKGQTYLAGSRAALDTLEVDLARNPESDPTELRKRFDSGVDQIRADAGENLSGISRQVWDADFEKRQQTLWHKVSLSNATTALQSERDTLGLNSDRLYDSGNFEAADGLIANSPVLTDGMKAELREKGRVTTLRGVVRRAAVSNDPVEIREAQDLIKAGENFLTESEYRVLRNSLKTSLEQATAEEQAERDIAKAMALGDFQVKVDKGEGTMAELREMYVNKQVGDTKYIEIQRRIEKVSKDKMNLANDTIRLTQAMTSGARIDPKDKGFIKVVDKADSDAFDFINASQMTPQEKKAAVIRLDQMAVRMANQTGMLPKRVEGMFRADARNGSPEQVVYTAKLYQKLQVDAPFAIEGLSSEVLAIYKASDVMTRAGVPVAEAVKLARDNVTLAPETKSILRQGYAKPGKKSANRLNTLLDGDEQFDREFWGHPRGTTEQQGVYAATEFQYYMLFNGDMELTTQATNEAFKRMYSGSASARPDKKMQAMAHAPERVYNMESEAVRSDMAFFAKKMDVSNPSKMFLRTDGRTVSEGRNATYLAYTLDEQGEPVQVFASPGTPLRYKPGMLQRSQATTARSDAMKAIAKRKQKRSAPVARKRDRQLSVANERVKAENRGATLTPSFTPQF